MLLVGDGQDKDVLQEFISNNGLSDHIIIMGHLSHGECLNIIRVSNIVLSSSLSEAFPNNLLEGAMYKKPIIATDVGGVKEIVIHEKTGFLFESRNNKDYLGYIYKLIKSPGLQKLFGENGYQHVMENYTIEKKILHFNSIICKDLNLN